MAFSMKISSSSGLVACLLKKENIFAFGMFKMTLSIGFFIFKKGLSS
jgi:hypothetical protein